jgi:hypothetical protein
MEAHPLTVPLTVLWGGAPVFEGSRFLKQGQKALSFEFEERVGTEAAQPKSTSNKFGLRKKSKRRIEVRLAGITMRRTSD